MKIKEWFKKKARVKRFKANREIISILSRIANHDADDSNYQSIMNILKDMVRIHRNYGASDAEIRLRFKIREVKTCHPELLPYIFNNQ